MGGRHDARRSPDPHVVDDDDISPFVDDFDNTVDDYDASDHDELYSTLDHDVIGIDHVDNSRRVDYEHDPRGNYEHRLDRNDRDPRGHHPEVHDPHSDDRTSS